MKFSLILNSRRRTALLNNLLTSVYENTSNLNDVEILISTDSDDEDSKRFLSNISFPNLRYEVIPRSLHLNNRLTSLAFQSTGKYIFILNDDTEIVTPEWDRLAWEFLELIPDQIVYGYTYCNSVDKEGPAKYASFPIVSRRSVDILGYFMHPAFTSLGGDVHLWRLYNEIHRTISIPVHIRHTRHETIQQVINPDEVAYQMRSNVTGDWWGMDISEDVEKLRKAINETNVSHI